MMAWFVVTLSHCHVVTFLFLNLHEGVKNAQRIVYINIYLYILFFESRYPLFIF